MAPPEQVAADLAALVDFREEGLDPHSLQDLVEERLVPHLVSYDRPEFHSLYNFFPEEGAAYGARIALIYNQGVTNWQVSPGGAMLEELCCQALCRLFSLSDGADATFMYCGTYANQQALYLALHRYAERHGFDLGEQGLEGFREPARLAVLCSSEAHFSLRHAVRIMGLGEESLIPVAADDQLRLDMAELKRVVAELRSDRDIFCIVSTGGTTSTGSVDPVLPVCELAEEIGAWVHLDGAYGFAYRLLPEKERLFEGAELADSICWDPHKQFGVPIPSSLLFTRNGQDLLRMAIHGKYFNRKEDDAPSPGLKSPPSTRPLSALPLVTSIRLQGISGVRQRLRSPLTAIERAAARLAEASDVVLCHRPDTGLLCLRLCPPGLSADQLEELQLYLFERVKSEGKRSVSITRVRGEHAIRLVAISPSVTAEALLETVDYLRQLSQDFSPP